MTTANVTTDAAAGESERLRRPWAGLFALLIGVSLIILDGSLVNVLIPSMVDDLKLNRAQVLWCNSAYSLVFAALLITAGRLGDRIGRRRFFMTGTIIFMVGSVIAGAAPNAGILILARVVSAVGGAMMLPTSTAIINVEFTGERRAVAFGMFGAVFGGMAALGPVLGGWLTQDFSWRWAFFVNIPVGLISLVLMFKFIPHSVKEKMHGLDPVGVVLSAFGLGSLILGLIDGQQYGWWKALDAASIGPFDFDPPGLSITPVAITVGLVLLVAFVLWEAHRTRTGKVGLVDTSMFKIRRFSFGSSTALIVALGELGVLFVLPLWIESVHGFEPLETGAVLAVLAVGTFISGGLARKVSVAIGTTRLVRFGMILEITGVIGVGCAMSTSWSPWWLAPPLIVYGLGLGFDAAQLTNVALEDIPVDQSGSASSVTSTFRQVGSALGVALLGAILFSTFSGTLTRDISKETQYTAQQQQQIVDTVVNTSGQAIITYENVPGMAPVVTDSKQSYTDAARYTAFAAAGLIAIGLVFSLGLPKDERPDRKKTTRATPAV
ncbi:MAG: DHA2 family efflux MFS transporter permease subunit [Actinomycetes bacterium]